MRLLLQIEQTRMMLMALLISLLVLLGTSISLTDEVPSIERSSLGEPDSAAADFKQTATSHLRLSPPPSDTELDADNGEIVKISPESQSTQLLKAKIECLQQMQQLQETTANRSLDVVESCPYVWDGIACWPETPAGQVLTQSCPPYVNNFRINGVASRRCQDDGRWFFHVGHNRTWTNYSLCSTDNGHLFKPDHEPTLLIRHLPIIRLIYNTGYSLSLVVLLMAVTVILYFRKLRCPRNTLHLNLFASFILRASMALTRDLLLTEGMGMAKDVRVLDTGQRSFDSDSSHWECRLLMTIFNYALTANYAWIFVEGLYLHTLLFLAVFSESSSVVAYIIFGWVSPFVCVVLWAIVRLTVENDLCWNTHPTPGLFWIIKGPVLVTILLNFCFFINIVRVLFTKLQAFNSSDSRKYRHRKLAKSALVLIPLFGVPYIVFLGLQENIAETVEIFKLYFEMTFNSFNGVIVAMLYCFLNGEVQAEIRKNWSSCRPQSTDHSRHHHHGSMSSRRATMTSNYYTTRCSESQAVNSSFRMGNSTVDADDHSFRLDNSAVDADDQSSKAAQFNAVLNDHGYQGDSSSSDKIESVPLRRMDNVPAASAAASDCLTSKVQMGLTGGGRNSWQVTGERDADEWNESSRKKSMTPAVILNL